ncbi:MULTISPECIES: DUF6218 family protein [Amycolatopsis]|uniref:DUF6218 family protein n=1 Tax=Amycolatopsis albidoflavus TaxID=102226 RepID=A0ABW5I4F4_9PSEU
MAGVVTDEVGDRVAARRFLLFLERRAVAAVYGWWKPREVASDGAFREIVERWPRYADTVVEEPARGKAIVDLEWGHELPDNVEAGGLEDLRWVAGVRPAERTLVVLKELTIARTLRWLVSVWAESEKAKNRRRYVRDVREELLPPSWLSAVQVASATRVPR